jgi:hypothetical protein
MFGSEYFFNYIGWNNCRCPSTGQKQFAESITCSRWRWWAETRASRCSTGWTTKAQVYPRPTTQPPPLARITSSSSALNFAEYANLAFWTGGWRDKNSSTWLWLPWGAQVVEPCWAPGEPRGDPRQESRIHFRAADKGWHDDQTRAAASVLCEITSWKCTLRRAPRPRTLICLGGIWVIRARTGAWAQQSNFGSVRERFISLSLLLAP